MPCQHGLDSKVGKCDLKGFSGVSVLGELGPTSKTEKPSGFDQSAQGNGVESRVCSQRSQEFFGTRAPLHGGRFL